MQRYIKLICFVVLAGIFASCKDVLDKDPLAAPNPENYWKTEAEANRALIACYAKLKEPILFLAVVVMFGTLSTLARK